MSAPELIVSTAIRGVITDGVPVLSPITEGGHRPFGVLKVDPLPYGFRVWHAKLEALGDALPGSDETLGGLNITAHASWGMEYVNVTLCRNGAKVPVAQMCVPNANVWLHLTGYRFQP